MIKLIAQFGVWWQDNILGTWQTDKTIEERETTYGKSSVAEEKAPTNHWNTIGFKSTWNPEAQINTSNFYWQQQVKKVLSVVNAVKKLTLL